MMPFDPHPDSVSRPYSLRGIKGERSTVQSTLQSHQQLLGSR